MLPARKQLACSARCNRENDYMIVHLRSNECVRPLVPRPRTKRGNEHLVLLQGLKVRQQDASTPGLKGIRSGNVSIFAMIIVDSEFRPVHCRGNRPDCLLFVVARIVFRADVIKAKRTNRRHLCDVLIGFRPAEMGRIARQNDDAAGWIRLQFIGIELVA